MVERLGTDDRPITYGRIVKIAPEPRVYILGAVLCLALVICARHFGDRGGRPFMVSLGIAGIAYVLGVRELLAAPRFAKRVVAIGLLLAAVWHIAFLRQPPGADDDI